MESKQFLTAKEAAVLLQHTPRKIREYLRDGLIPGMKLGRSWRIPRKALEERLAGRVREETVC